MRQCLLWSTIIALLAACPALAGTETITLNNNQVYSWLQLPMTADIIMSVGSDTGIVGHMTGTIPDNYRFGKRWMPSFAMTGAPTAGVNPGTTEQRMGTTGQNYWMELTLDQARWIDYVGVEWNTGNYTSLTKYYIQAYDTVKKEWVTVGESPDLTSPTAPYGYINGTINGWRDGSLGSAVAIVPGEYQSIRVLVKAGDYTCGNSATQGGPGILVIEPMAVGREITIETSQVNWANVALGASATASPALMALPSSPAPRRNAAWLVNGLFIDDEYQTRALGAFDDDSLFTTDNGVRKWANSVWVDFDLGQARWIDEVVALWWSGGYGTDFNVQYGLVDEDGVIIDWLDVTGRGDAVQHGGLGGATSVTFDGVEAQYWRISEAVFGVNNSSRCILNQVLMYGTPPVPEPATLSLLALGGLAVLRRRT